MKTLLSKGVFVCILLFITFNCLAQAFSKEFIDMKVSNSPHSGRLHHLRTKNSYRSAVTIRFKNEFDGHSTDVKIKRGGVSTADLTFTVALARPNGKSEFIEIKRFESATVHQPNDSTDTPNDPSLDKTTDKDKDAGTDMEQDSDKDKDKHKDSDKDKRKDSDKGKDKDTDKGKNKDDGKEKKEDEKNKDIDKDSLTIERIIPVFLGYIDTISFYSPANITTDSILIIEHISNLRNWTDKDAYIKDKDLNTFIQAQHDSIDHYRSNDSLLIAVFLKGLKKVKICNKEECVDSMRTILSERLFSRESILKELEAEVLRQSEVEETNWKLIGVCAFSCILLIGLMLWYRKARRKDNQRVQKKGDYSSAPDAASLIVVRQKTAPTLKKQSLDDVIDNEAYYKIDCKEFCNDSAVRTMYIKNTCIKDIYNLYAEDLRNPDNPKEDGCLVLGRWVFDEKTNQYDVSLEYIVTPGDDAIFSEYELNFGGKIQIKKADMLKRLRRDTGLQYDLTCWVHSHPGLGVFFSNSDNNVQMQLKQELHPHILTAMVIDILTAEQETGIFTFKNDSTVNSKNDLGRLFSLEEMYQWAVESERRSFNKTDYFNSLDKARQRINECYGIELSNGAIIDMTYLMSSSNGFLGFVHGYTILQGERTECITTTVSKAGIVPDNDVVGCFVVAAHCSIPSIRKLIAPHLSRIKFVLVYTATDGLLTSIPVIDHDLCSSEDYYGEHLLEDLKIWTRRRR